MKKREEEESMKVSATKVKDHNSNNIIKIIIIR